MNGRLILPLVVFAICLPLLGLLVVLLRREAKAAVRRLAQEPIPTSPGGRPARIRLRRPEPYASEDTQERLESQDEIEAAMEVQARQLLDLGFQDAGLFEVEEIPEIRIRGLVKPEESIRAIVERHPDVGVWTEVITRYEDGTRFALSNFSKWPVLAVPPNLIVRRAPGLGAAELYRRALAARPVAPMEPASVAEFVPAYEEAWAELMDWLNLRGGYDEHDIRAIAEGKGLQPTDEQVAAWREVQEEQSWVGLNEALYRRFFAEADLSDLERARLRDRLVIVHDRLPIEVVAGTFGLTVEEADAMMTAGDAPDGLYDDWVDREAAVAWSKRPPRVAFAILNDHASKRHQFCKIGEVGHPVEADIYAPARR
jgi:hypothetical protein